MTPSAASTTAALNSTAPRISDWTWPRPEPPIQATMKRVQTPTAREPDDERQRHEDPQRLVLGVDAEDRDAVAPHVGPHRGEQARLAQLRVRRDRHVVGRDQQLARLDDRLERVGELRDDRHLDRGLAVVGAEARGRVGHVGVRRLADDPRARAAAATSSAARSARSSSTSRSPTTMSAVPARIGATSLRDRARVVLVVGVGVDDHVGAELEAGVEAGLEAGGQALVVRQPDDVVDAVLARRPRSCGRSSRRR